ncbi:hypothetical protein Q0Z83_023570 [Actinoplanes sichuanensis]|nr:hypothetical protein Q0Z83_023570 [Actinoplanes sichuanensis]
MGSDVGDLDGRQRRQMPVAERRQEGASVLDGPGVHVMEDTAGGGEVTPICPAGRGDQLGAAVEIRPGQAARVGLEVLDGWRPSGAARYVEPVCDGDGGSDLFESAEDRVEVVG